jgi:hypothetical protein
MHDRDIVGRLPYFELRRGPFRILRMPAFTHMLGPVIDSGEGKPQTRLVRRLSIARSLIDQLPPHSYFHQHLDPALDDELAFADGLAFQERDFSVSTQYTFKIDCRNTLDDMWGALYAKTRNNIRGSEKACSVKTVDDPKQFVEFYLKNNNAAGRDNRVDFEFFPSIFSECRARQHGCILGAFDREELPIAMVFLVWGHGTMYYLLSTRALNTSDPGAVSLLIWDAMKRAHELGLSLDLDGAYSSGTVRFLSNFGGQIKMRLSVRRSRMPYRALQMMKRYYSQDESYRYT